MLLAAGLTISIIIIVFALAFGKAAGKDKWKDKWIEQRKKEEEFDGWKYCDDDCYMCDFQKSCERSAMKEGQL